jgi:hypothetical protein
MLVGRNLPVPRLDIAGVEIKAGGVGHPPCAVTTRSASTTRSDPLSE